MGGARGGVSWHDELEMEPRAGVQRIGSPDQPDGLLDAVSDGIVSVDSRGSIAAVNEAFTRIAGCEREQLLGRPLGPMLPELDLAAPASGRRVASTVRRDDGAEAPVELTVLADEDGGSPKTVVVRDLSETVAADQRLRSISDRDAVTGLLSRRRFEQDAERELGRSQRYGGGAMLVLGLDNFSHLNDQLGNRAGDELLRETGELISERVREIDLCGRLGGDQFGVLLAEVSAERARAIGEEIVAIIHGHRYRLSGTTVTARASAGVLGLETQPRDASEAMSWAELAMRRAKAMGGGRVVAFEDGLRADRESTRSWSERIREALDSNAFVPHFQPILDLSTDTVEIWELLIRMRGEGGEMIPPDAFLPTAERYGLIHELDRWVVRNAVAAMGSQAESSEISLEINLSGKSIGDRELLDTIRGEIDGRSVDPTRIIFEVTETAAIGNLEEASSFGRALRELGCGFALDDFGTGFASFLYLKRLPLTHLKIDGDFISGLGSSAVDQLVVQAIVEIAHGMGLKTIAEYVEDRETIERLRELGVDYCQGFEVGRPRRPTPPDRLPVTE